MRTLRQLSAGCSMALVVAMVLPLAHGSFAQEQNGAEPVKALQVDGANFKP